MAAPVAGPARIAWNTAIYAESKIDCHCHVLDPQNFAYPSDIAYRPAGQETGSAQYFENVLNAYGVQHALLVGPNSGYNTDNRCMLEAIAHSAGRFKGVAVVRLDASLAELQDLAAQGVVGVAFNYALQGLEFYSGAGPLTDKLAQLGLYLQVQVAGEQMHALQPFLRDCAAPLLVDHCGRPEPAQRAGDKGFDAVLKLAEFGHASIKLSGFAKFSQEDFPFADTHSVISELISAFGPQHCLWASDWPFLKAPRRLDYGPLLQLLAHLVPDAHIRRQILWDTPKRLFDFGA